MRMKKGEWSLQTIAAFILILIVLVILVIAFREKFAGLMQGFTDIFKGATEAGAKEAAQQAVRVPGK